MTGLAVTDALVEGNDIHDNRFGMVAWRLRDSRVVGNRMTDSRSAGLLRRVGIEDEVTFTGGVTRNVAMIKAIEEKLDKKLNVSEESHYMGALGAALFALDHILASRAPRDQVEAKP